MKNAEKIGSVTLMQGKCTQTSDLIVSEKDSATGRETGKFIITS